MAPSNRLEDGKCFVGFLLLHTTGWSRLSGWCSVGWSNRGDFAYWHWKICFRPGSVDIEQSYLPIRNLSISPMGSGCQHHHSLMNAGRWWSMWYCSAWRTTWRRIKRKRCWIASSAFNIKPKALCPCLWVGLQTKALELYLFDIH